LPNKLLHADPANSAGPVSKPFDYERFSIVNYLILIFQIAIAGIIYFLFDYTKEKGKNLAKKEDLEKLTTIVEDIKLSRQKSLSEYDIKLESFRKVIEIRIDAANQLAEIRKMFFDLYIFQKGEAVEVNDKVHSFTSYMNAYIPFFQDCRNELDTYSKEFQKIENKNVSNKDFEPTYKAMEALLSKILEYN